MRAAALHADYPAYDRSEYIKHLATPRSRATTSPSGPFQGESEAHAKFTPKTPVVAVSPYKGQHNADHHPVFPVGEGVPFDARTALQTDYPAYDRSEYARNAAAPRPRAVAAVASVPFEGQSEAHAKFTPKTPSGPVGAAAKKGQFNVDHHPVFPVGEGVPFDARTALQTDYPAYDRSEYARNAATPRRPATPSGAGVPFEGQSESQAQFRAQQPAVRQSPVARQRDNGIMPTGDGRFDALPSSRADYQPPARSAYERPSSATRRSGTVAAASPIKFEAQSTTQATYAPPPAGSATPGSARRSARPQSAVVFGDMADAGRFVTSASAAYTPPSARCPAALLPKRQPSPTGHILYRRESVDEVFRAAASPVAATPRAY